MIKHKSSVSPLRPGKKSLRPHSSGICQTRQPPSSTIIHTIINSLQQNVKDLKTYYRARESHGGLSGQDKSQKGFRVKRTLVRNSSQSNLHPKTDKSENDIFEIRNEYLRVHGRISNNIAQLYQFYRKNLEKREKSTRILASMEISNGGQSVSGGKESLLKHSQLFNHRENSRRELEEQKIDEANQDSHQIEAPVPPKSPFKQKKAEKTSELASELISKGCYNIMNIANLLNCKKYRLTKEKEESFRRPKEKQPQNEIRVEINKENNINAENKAHIEEPSIKQANNNEKIEVHRSPQIKNKPDISFKKIKDNCIVSNTKSFECSSISKQDKDIEKGIFEDTSTKKEAIDKKLDKVILDLEQSPILAKNGKEFEKSKYYVKPIPQKVSLQDEKSISLRSHSRIMDTSIPFDL